MAAAVPGVSKIATVFGGSPVRVMQNHYDDNRDCHAYTDEQNNSHRESRLIARRRIRACRAVAS